MQIESDIVRYQYTLLDGYNEIQRNLTIPSNDRDAEHLKFSLIAGGNVKWQCLWKIV